MDYHPVKDQLLALFESHKIWFETFQHQAVVANLEDVHLKAGYNLENGIKAIICQIRRGTLGSFHVMLCYPAHKRFNNGKARRYFHAQDVRFAETTKLSELTGGITPGAVPPFGALFGLPVYCDPSVFDKEKMVFNAGDQRFSVGIKTSDWKKMCEMTLVDIV